MKLKTLLNAYKNYGRLTIINNEGEEVDKGKNGLCIRALWGDFKVLSFEAIGDELLITIKKEY